MTTPTNPQDTPDKVEEIVTYRHIADKIELNKIRGRYQEDDGQGNIAGGDDTIESIRIVAEKVNEIISILEKYDTR